MKIILIQQAEPRMEWEPRYDAASFERAAEASLNCGAAPFTAKKGDASGYRVYTGTGRAAAETAEMLFEFAQPPERSALLDDMPLRPFCKTDKSLPLRLWKVMGEAQWLLGGRRQPESRGDALRRAGRFIDLLEREDRDCVVICGGFAMKALKSVLRRRDYCLEGGGLFSKPLERVRAVKRSMHCGGCHHNCLLTEPKCQIGMNKARERQIKQGV